jgi:hypothetical protein
MARGERVEFPIYAYEYAGSEPLGLSTFVRYKDGQHGLSQALGCPSPAFRGGSGGSLQTRTEIAEIHFCQS